MSFPRRCARRSVPASLILTLAVAAGDVSQDAYLIVGMGFREKISP